MSLMQPNSRAEAKPSEKMEHRAEVLLTQTLEKSKRNKVNAEKRRPIGSKKIIGALFFDEKNQQQQKSMVLSIDSSRLRVSRVNLRLIFDHVFCFCFCYFYFSICAIPCGRQASMKFKAKNSTT